MYDPGFVFKCTIGEIKMDEIKAKMLAKIAVKCGKLTAIQALRCMSNIGLRDAKLTIEWLMGHYDWIEW